MEYSHKKIPFIICIYMFYLERPSANTRSKSRGRTKKKNQHNNDMDTNDNSQGNYDILSAYQIFA